MKLKEYIKSLQELLSENPKYGNLEVYSSSDPEGNSFNYVVQPPGIGRVNPSELGQYTVESIFQDQEDWLECGDEPVVEDYQYALEEERKVKAPRFVPNVVIVAP